LSVYPADGPRTSSDSKRGIFAAVIGNALEFYDFATYAFFAIAIGHTFFPTQDAWTSLLLSVATFGVGFVTRPLGGIFIGAYADRAGRVPAMILTISLMSLGMIILALTPGYRVIGGAAPALIVFARLLQGFALGGEVGPSTAYLMEAAPPGRRGAYASWQFASQGLSILVAGLVGFAMAQTLSPTDMDDWGWRVPFLVGLLIVPAGFYVRLQARETGEPGKLSTKAVLGQLFASHRGTLALTVPILLCGTVSTYIGNYMTTFAISTLKLPTNLALAATIVVGACTFGSSILAGHLADRYGRRPILILPRILLVLIAYPAFLLLTTHPAASTLLGLSALLATLSAMSGATSLIVITELLPRRVRSAGLSITYAVTIATFGGTTQFVVTWLIGATGDILAPAYYLIATSALGVAAMLAVPETRDLAPEGS
jgi:MFS family permease